MTDMIYLERTPTSVGGLAIEFAVAAIFTGVMWKMGFPLRGVSRRKDGPLTMTHLLLIGALTIFLFFVLAAVTAGERKDHGLPIFW
jgi:hypothetical protein